MQAYRRNGDISASGGSLLVFLPFIIIGLIATIIICLLIAGIYTLTPMQPSALSLMAVSVSLICVLFSGFLAGRLGVAPGWIAGCITGLGYAIIMIIAGWISTALPFFSIQPLIILFACSIVGAFGGILGINLKPQRRNRYR